MAKPNIVVIMADDVGIWNIGAYHRGMMAGRTPHLDKLGLLVFLTSSFLSQFRKARRRNAMSRQIPRSPPSPANISPIATSASRRSDAEDPLLAMRLWDVSEEIAVAL